MDALAPTGATAPESEVAVPKLATRVTPPTDAAAAVALADLNAPELAAR